MTSGRHTEGPLVIVYTDGASRGNPGPSACGVAIFDSAGVELKQFGKPMGVGTNNEAEYRGVAEGLEAAKAFTAGWVEVRTDSELVVRQLNGKYAIREPRMQALAERVRAAAASFTRVDFRHVPREHEGASLADRLANRALDLEQRAGSSAGRR